MQIQIKRKAKRPWSRSVKNQSEVNFIWKITRNPKQVYRTLQDSRMINLVGLKDSRKSDKISTRSGTISMAK